MNPTLECEDSLNDAIPISASRSVSHICSNSSQVRSRSLYSIQLSNRPSSIDCQSVVACESLMHASDTKENDIISAARGSQRTVL